MFKGFVCKKEITINDIRLTTSEDIPYMFKPRYCLNPRNCIKFIAYNPFALKERDAANALSRLEEKYLVKVVQLYFKVPKEFNRIIGYSIIGNVLPNNYKLIDCTDD